MRLWIIDAGHLFYAQNSIYQGYRFDYKKLRNKLEEFGPIWKGYFFQGLPDEHKSSQASFHKWLSMPSPSGPNLITELYSLKDDTNHKAFCKQCSCKVDLICACCGGTDLQRKRQRGVDIGIVMRAIMDIDKYETLLLSAGDGDFVEMVKRLQDRGKRVELAIFQHGIDAELQSLADQVYSLNDFATEIGKTASGTLPRG